MTVRRRLFVALVFFTAVLFAAGLAVLARPREPSFDGKRLSEWLLIVDADTAPVDRTRAENAVRSIGSNAIPTLLRMAKAKDSPLKEKVLEIAGQQDLVDIEIPWAVSGRVRAVTGFSLLGDAASAAVPALAELLDDDVACDTAAASLVGVGPEGVKLVAGMLTNPIVDRRFIAVVTLATIGLGYRDTNISTSTRAALDRKAEVAVPPLVSCLSDSNFPFRAKAAVALRLIGQRPDLVVPAILQTLDDKGASADEIRAGVSALARFGSAAKSATPVIGRLLTHSDERIRKAATNALNKINGDISDGPSK